MISDEVLLAIINHSVATPIFGLQRHKINQK